MSILSCKSNYIKLNKLHKIQSSLIKDYEVLFANIKGREQSNMVLLHYAGKRSM